MGDIDSDLDYFCRFAIRKSKEWENCSLCPSRNLAPKTPGRYKMPVLAALPAPTIIDLSPRDIGLSVGFKRAGCQVDRGVGESHTHQLWQVRRWRLACLVKNTD
jgi:hypothetical protein